MTSSMKIAIRGMHCASCKALIEDVCKDIPGIISCDVAQEQGAASLTHNGTVTFARVKQELENLGDYSVDELV